MYTSLSVFISGSNSTNEPHDLKVLAALYVTAVDASICATLAMYVISSLAYDVEASDVEPKCTFAIKQVLALIAQSE